MTKGRLEAFREVLAERRLDAFLVASLPNRAYLSGFTGSSGTLFITAEEALLFTDFRYHEQARVQAPAFTVVPEGVERLSTLVEAIRRIRPQGTGVESQRLTVQGLKEWEEAAGDATEFVPVPGLVEELRKVKDAGELAILRRAAGLADAGFAFLLDFIRPGRTEREISLELEFFLRRGGASGPGFDFIVASGPRGSLPHGVASDRVVSAGELVTVDFGCFVEGYTSDLTRTVAVGKAPGRLADVYAIVREAQEAGVAAIRPGRTGGEVDAVARDIIARAGFGEFYGHGLGHGVGLEIHEAPRLKQGGTEVLAPGMVVTIEPGIYLPGEGGVRIEDMVLVAEDGGERLTACPRELLSL